MNPLSKPLYFNETLRRIERACADQALMGRAGAAACQWVEELLGKTSDPKSVPILVLAGPGNNGGDAFSTARLLRQHGFFVEIVWTGEESALPPEALNAYQQLMAEGGQTALSIPAGHRWQLIIDGLFGAGLKAPLEGINARLAEAANMFSQDFSCPVLALDCPSGLESNTGKSLGVTIKATHTLAFIGARPGFYTADGPDYCGQIRVHDLGLAAFLTEMPDGALISTENFASCLSPRRRNTHKGSYGSVGIVGGAASMIGAALLSGRAALKLGAGRVLVGLLDPHAPGADIFQPELMLKKPEALFDSGLSVLVCGPGMGRSVDATDFLKRAMDEPLPLVLDADAINILAFDEILQLAAQSRSAPLILLPHPTEAGRLLDVQTESIQENRIHTAQEIAERYQAWVLLKGCGSIVVTPEGRWWVNTTGNPGLAGAGSGDVLSGMLGALLSQGWPPTEAIMAACCLHGQAADDLVIEGIGPIGLCAGEIPEAARRRFNIWIRQTHQGF